MKKNVRKACSVLIIAGLLIVVLYRLFNDSFDEIVLHLKELSLVSLLCLVLCSVLYLMAEGTIVTMLMKKHNPCFPLTGGIQTVLQGCFYRGISFGSGTQAGQIYFLAQKGIQPYQSMSTLTISYAMQRVGVFLYASLCLLFQTDFFLSNYRSYLVYIKIGYFINFAVIAFLILLVASKKFHAFITFLLEKLTIKGKYKMTVDKAINQMDLLSSESTAILWDRRLLLLISLLELVKFSFWYLIPYITVAGDIQDGGYLLLSETIAAAAFANVLIGVIPSPSGIMSTELIFAALFTILLGKAQAGAILVIYRTFTYIVPFLLGVLSWFIVKRRREQCGAGQ